MDCSGDVVGLEFAIFADVDQNEFIFFIQTSLDLVSRSFADAAAGFVDDFKKTRGMIGGHGFSENESYQFWMLSLPERIGVATRFRIADLRGKSRRIAVPPPMGCFYSYNLNSAICNSSRGCAKDRRLFLCRSKFANPPFILLGATRPSAFVRARWWLSTLASA